MTDPVATVEKIVKIGLKIKEAVDTVRHNEDECREIRKRVLRFSAILTQLQQTGMVNDSPAMSGALEDLEETLQQALELVTACQERSTIHRLVRAGDLAKQLRRVKDDILNKVMLASFAIHATTIVLLTIQAGGHPLPQQPEDDAGAVRSNDGARSELNDVENDVLAGMETSVSKVSCAIREFRWSELKAATNDFSDGNIIGEGGQFFVYKGILKDGNIVAVKKNRHGSWSDTWRPHINCDQLIHVLSNIVHKNIVQFVGYCYGVLSTAQLFKRKKRSAKERRFIWVEEYLPNGDLQEIIHESRHDWSSLFRIIDGVAQGVHYLHEHHVVHMDVKPSNILLDSDMNPIITDFNISVLLDNNDEMILDSVLGTMGYAAPEYMSEGIVSTKNDVYGYGITLFEAVGSISRCKRPVTEYRKTTDYHSDLWAWKAWQAGRIEDEFDPSSFDGSQLTEIKRCVQVGLLCTQFDRADRPTMADVLEMLRGEKELPIPKRPSWYSRTSSSD